MDDPKLIANEILGIYSKFSKLSGFKNDDAKTLYELVILEMTLGWLNCVTIQLQNMMLI